MSIIDWLMLFFWMVAIATGLLIVFAPIAIVRWWMRRLDADDRIERSAPRVRTRIERHRACICHEHRPICNCTPEVA